MKRVLLIHDLCMAGKAALFNMLPVLNVMGIETVPLPTMLLSTHTGGFGTPQVHRLPSAYLMACASHLREQNISFDMIFIGYLGSADLVETVLEVCDSYPDVPVIFDPIMGDQGRYYSNFDDAYRDSLLRLLSKADYLFPNWTESCLLADVPYTEQPTDEQLQTVLSFFGERGVKKAVITGMKNPCGAPCIAYHDVSAETLCLIDTPLIPGHFHGTGDLFDGVVTGALLQGKSETESIRMAHQFVSRCIQDTLSFGTTEREGIAFEKNLWMLHE